MTRFVTQFSYPVRLLKEVVAMIKKIFTLILISCFLSFVITPTYAYAETTEESLDKAEEDREKMDRMLLTALGIGVVVWILFYTDFMSYSDFAESLIEKNRNTGKGFRFGVPNFELESNFSAIEKDEVRFPIAGITYSW